MMKINPIFKKFSTSNPIFGIVLQLGFLFLISLFLVKPQIMIKTIMLISFIHLLLLINDNKHYNNIDKLKEMNKETSKTLFNVIIEKNTWYEKASLYVEQIKYYKRILLALSIKKDLKNKKIQNETF